MIKNFIKTHYGAIILSIIVGLIMVGPQLYFIYSLGGEYEGLYMMKSDAETNYLARMQDFKDGNGLGNPFIYEHKDGFPLTFFTISEGILEFPGRVLDISTTNLNLFYKFLLPLITSLLIYLLAFRLTDSKSWSLVTTIVAVLGDSLFSIPQIMNIFEGNAVFSQFALYARPFSPGFSSVLFFAYLNILLTAVRTKEWKWFICLGSISALSFYIYFFNFTFLLALNIVFIGLYYFLKDREVSVKLGWATLAGFIVGLPVLINAVKVNQHPYYKNIALFVDIYSSRAPVFSTAGLVILGLFVWYFIKSKKELSRDYFLLGLIVTSFVVINQQVLTGIWLHEGHYHLYFNKPIFTLILFFTALNLWGRKKLAPLALIVISALSFYSVIFIQYSSYNSWKDTFSQKQDYVKIFDWLNENSPKESVVFANEDISEYVPVFTPNNVYMETHAVYYLMPPQRMTDSLFMYLKISKFSPDDVGSELFFHPGGEQLRAKAQEDIKNYSLLSDDIIMAYPPNTLEMYRSFWKESIKDNLKRYRLDYLVWDKSENPEWDLGKYANLKLVYDINNLYIFKTVD